MENVQCFLCRQYGHKRRDCPRKPPPRGGVALRRQNYGAQRAWNQVQQTEGRTKHHGQENCTQGNSSAMPKETAALEGASASAVRSSECSSVNTSTSMPQKYGTATLQEDAVTGSVRADSVDCVVGNSSETIKVQAEESASGDTNETRDACQHSHEDAQLETCGRSTSGSGQEGSKELVDRTQDKPATKSTLAEAHCDGAVSASSVSQPIAVGTMSSAVTFKCFNCGQAGHKRRDCPAAAAVSGRADSRSRTSKKQQGCVYPKTSEPVIDTHCHVEYVLERFRCSSYDDFVHRFPSPPAHCGCIMSFCDLPAFSDALGIWRDLISIDSLWATFGLHPHHAKHFGPRLEEKIIEACTHPKALALGEIGLDYSERCPSSRSEQDVAFRRLLRLAKQLEKPVVVHCADAEDDLYQCLHDELPHDWKIHLHCYSGSWQTAQRFLDTFSNVYFGFTGLITYHRAEKVQEVVANLPADRILLETDAPYLVPVADGVPKGYRWSIPAMVLFVAVEVARIRSVDLDAFLQSARSNTTVMYGI